MGFRIDDFLKAVDSGNLNINTSILKDMLEILPEAEKPVVIFPFNNYSKYLFNIYHEDIAGIMDDDKPGWSYRGNKIISLDQSMKLNAGSFFCCSVQFNNELTGSIKAHRLFKNQKIYYFPALDKYKKEKDPYKDLQFYSHLQKEMDYQEIVTMLDPGKLFTLLEMLKACKSIEGDILEYGVWLGGSAFAIAKALKHNAIDKDLILVDRFEESDQNSAYSVMCIDEIRHNLSFFDRIKIVQTDFEKDPAFFDGLKFAFIHYDAPYNEGVLMHLHKSLSAGGIMIIDNYNNTIGNYALYDRWFSLNTPSKPIFSSVNINQGIFIKNFV